MVMIKFAFAFTSQSTQLTGYISYISPFVFTQTLLPLLTSAAREPDSDVRIVNVSAHVDACE